MQLEEFPASFLNKLLIKAAVGLFYSIGKAGKVGHFNKCSVSRRKKSWNTAKNLDKN